MNDPRRWQLVKEIFDAAVARPAKVRAAFVRDRCREDPVLLQEVESLLAADADRGSFLDRPVHSLPGEHALGVAAAGRTRALAPDARLGAYRITSLIGIGGMGEVYRAHDTALGRDVAIKVLRSDWMAQSGHRHRFEREARLLAALNHPNIGTIYGIEAQDGLPALVLELVEGETLAERIADHRSRTGGKRGLPLAFTLNVAAQIAAALEAAHERGIVHRDLKPSNVKITPAGRVKVLDFGIALPMRPVEAASGSPPYTREAIEPDVALGTAPYTSPEQLRGEPADQRTDLWAFGCVLFEMLTGARAFEGADTAEILSRVVLQEPDLDLLPDDTPAPVRRLLAACLEKDSGARLSHAAVAGFLIAEAAKPPSDASSSDDGSPRTRHALRIWAAAWVLGALSTWVVLRFAAPAPSSGDAPATRLSVDLAPAMLTDGLGPPARAAVAISPDGRTLVFSGAIGNERSLYVRPLDGADAIAIPGTQGAENPFFSPDGQWVGYWAGGAIRKVRLAGGPPVHVVDVVSLMGASWDDQDRIVFAEAVGPLLEVSARGGTARALTTLNGDRGELSHRLPHVLPGGDVVLFTITTGRFPRWDQAQLAAYSRRTGLTTTLVDGGANPWYVSTGHLAFVREGVLFVAPFDARRLALTAAAVALKDGVAQAAYLRRQRDDTGAAQFAVSSTGTLVYARGGFLPAAERSVVSVDRAGHAETLPLPPRPFATLRLSPDGRQVALSTFGRDRDIWVYALEHGTLSRLSVPGRSSVPIWTPDGERISYAVGTGGPDRLAWIRADSTGPADALVTAGTSLVPATWTPDGRHLIYFDIPPRTIWAMDVDNRAPAAVVAQSGEVAVGGADVSRNGRWIAYHSKESGRFEVYVQAYPHGTPRYQVSRRGGVSPVWRRDGRELFYLEPDADGVRLIAMPVATDGEFSFGRPIELFRGPYATNEPARAYDVTADGRRFLFLRETPGEAGRIASLNVVQNWSAELRRVAPGR